jgi:hypothetical protein
MTRTLLATITAFALLSWTGCPGQLTVQHPQDDDSWGDDDDFGDDDDVTDDDDDDDDVTDDDDDDVTDDDDDDDTADDDDDDTEELCCSSLEYPAYVMDSIAITTFLESDTYNEFLSLLLADALPPVGDTVIILFDPDRELDNENEFVAAFGIGEVNQDLFDLSAGSSPVNWDYSLDGGGHFESQETNATLNLSFGVTVPLHDAAIVGDFSGDFETLAHGTIAGGIAEADTVDIETSFGNLHDLIDGREMDADTDGDGTPDGWTFVMEVTGYQFL